MVEIFIKIIGYGVIGVSAAMMIVGGIVWKSYARAFFSSEEEWIAWRAFAGPLLGIGFVLFLLGQWLVS